MNNKVLYFCRSMLAKDGWVFPLEEEECYFPGVFVIEGDAGKLGDQYWFDAFDKQQLVTLELQRKERQIFVVHASVGIFFFRARRTQKSYVGKNSRLQQNHSSFWILEALPPDRLEAVCKQDDFYFIGAVETEPVSSVQHHNS